MHTQALGQDAVAAADAGAPAIAPEELAGVVEAVNQAMEGLRETHAALHGEVARLQRELRDAKTRLRRAQELAALGEMAAGIAHEIRNPLGSIRLYAEALVDDLDDKPESRDVAGRIVSSVGHLNAVVTDVLAFSRELRLDFERVPARELAQEALGRCRAELESSRVVCTLIAPEEMTVRCDQGLMVQALTNVLRNAIDAAADRHASGGGRVTLGVRTSAQRDADGRRVETIAFTVADNGSGIPAEVRERMFNPFFTTRAAGTGLGLPIVHRIVDAHDGWVVIDNARAGEDDASSDRANASENGDSGDIGDGDRGGGAGAEVALHLPAEGPGAGRMSIGRDADREAAEQSDHQQRTREQAA
jgi:signal transduction histidine kinase